MRTVRYWVKTGTLEAIRPGYEWLISETAVDAMLATGGHHDKRRGPRNKPPDKKPYVRRLKQ